MADTYRHSEFINCRDISEFAKIYAFKGIKGDILGRNKVFEVLRELGVLDKDNIPYQAYMKHFKTLPKEYQSGTKTYKKTIVLIKPDSLRYLADKINNYLEKKEAASIKKSFTFQQEVIKEDETIECGSPLDYSKEDALEWLKKLPEALRERSYFAIKVREKWGFEC